MKFLSRVLLFALVVGPPCDGLAHPRSSTQASVVATAPRPDFLQQALSNRELGERLLPEYLRVQQSITVCPTLAPAEARECLTKRFSAAMNYLNAQIGYYDAMANYYTARSTEARNAWSDATRQVGEHRSALDDVRRSKIVDVAHVEELKRSIAAGTNAAIVTQQKRELEEALQLLAQHEKQESQLTTTIEYLTDTIRVGATGTTVWQQLINRMKLLKEGFVGERSVWQSQLDYYRARINTVEAANARKAEDERQQTKLPPPAGEGFKAPKTYEECKGRGLSDEECEGLPRARDIVKRGSL